MRARAYTRRKFQLKLASLASAHTRAYESGTISTYLAHMRTRARKLESASPSVRGRRYVSVRGAVAVLVASHRGGSRSAAGARAPTILQALRSHQE